MLSTKLNSLKLLSCLYESSLLKLVFLEWSDSKSDCTSGFNHVEKPPCANFQSNRGNQWRLTAYCDYRLMTRACEFQRQHLL